MNKLSLKNAFQSYFHKKYSFDDFCTLDTIEHYKEIFYSKNTYSPSQKLKDFQKFLNLFVFEKLSINENVVFSYRKGVNAKDAIVPHQNHKYVLNTDIRSFFLNININRLREIILCQKEEVLIVGSDIETYLEQIVNIVTYQGILPVGSPSSPLISNAYLFELDNALQQKCIESNIAYSRYSDDFIFSSDDQNKLEKILETLQKMLHEYGFEINKKKTKLQTQGSNKIVLLGLVLTPQGYITVDNKQKKDIEVLLHFYLTDKEKFRQYFDDKFASSIEKVSGLLSHINSIDTYYISKLKRKYGSFIVNSFIHRDINVKF
jgi:RNA-directed DNA polymerase